MADFIPMVHAERSMLAAITRPNGRLRRIRRRTTPFTTLNRPTGLRSAAEEDEIGEDLGANGVEVGAVQPVLGRRGHYEVGVDARHHRRIEAAFTELAQTI